MTFAALTHSNGVSRVAIAMANEIAERNKGEVTLIPLFQYDQTVLEYVSPKVKVKPVFKMYFKGLAKILLLVPSKLLYKLIIREKYDIEIGFQYEVPTYIISGSTNKNALHIGWMHTYDDGLKYRDCYEQMDRMVCVSKCGAERLAKELHKPIPVDFCYNPINDKKIVEQGAEPIEINRGAGIQFVSVGRMSPEKGYARLLDIAARLKKEGYVFNLWLIGNGPALDGLMNASKKLEVDDIVFFLGTQQNPHKFTSKSDVFICSSFSEGYSTACTEAIILGVPVITTNCSGGEEIIEEAECGLLTQMDDESLYKGMKMVLDNPTILDNWKTKLAKTKIRFTQEKRIEKLYNLLKL